MFSKRLKELRNEAGLTQKEVATKLNISQPTYVQWESGRRSPSSETLEKFAKLFNVSTDYLLGKTNFRNLDPSLQNAQVLFRKTVSDFNLTKEQQIQFEKDLINYMEQRRKILEEEVNNE